MNVYMIVDGASLPDDVEIEEMYKKTKENQMLFDSFIQLKEAFDKGSLKALLYELKMMRPMLKEIGATRCIYICALAEEICMNAQDLNDDDQENAHWNLYPAFMEYMHEYLHFMDYMLEEDRDNDPSFKLSYLDLIDQIAISTKFKMERH